LSFNIISEEKQRLRERILALRQSHPSDEVQKAGRATADEIMAHPKTGLARNVCIYASMGKEVPTWDLMRQVLEDGKSISVPDWEGWKKGFGIRLAAIRNHRDFLTEERLVPQPRVMPDNVVNPSQVDLFIIPGVAFDRSGNRLGMGGGYFDRLLALASSKATLFGLAYGFQVVNHLPAESHDIPVHHVVTPGSRQVRGVDQ
jgi:5-formyltetrahydrofolate cyclo-ligase